MKGTTSRNNISVAVQQEYSRLASDYDNRWSHYVWASLNETEKRLALSDTDYVLDVGCGTGTLFELIASKYLAAGMVGVDLSKEMLDVARKKVNARVSLFAASANVLPFHSDSFDVVISCNAFHFFPDPEDCLAEFVRVLKPKGRLVITDWCDDYISCRVCDFFLRLMNRAHFKMYSRDELARMIQAASFRNIQVDCYKINWLWGLMTVTALAP